MLCDVSHPHSLVQRSWTFQHLKQLVLCILQHKQYIKSKQAIGIGSSDMSVSCKPSSPCSHSRPTGEDNTGYLNGPYAKPSPGNETFLHEMTMDHLWVEHFWLSSPGKKEYVLQHLQMLSG